MEEQTEERFIGETGQSQPNSFVQHNLNMVKEEDEDKPEQLYKTEEFKELSVQYYDPTDNQQYTTNEINQNHQSLQHLNKDSF